jgi:hypothetical protein
LQHVLGLREGFPQDAYNHCTAYPHLRIRIEEPWLDATVDAGETIIQTPKGSLAADHLICGSAVVPCVLNSTLRRAYRDWGGSL